MIINQVALFCNIGILAHIYFYCVKSFDILKRCVFYTIFFALHDNLPVKFRDKVLECRSRKHVFLKIYSGLIKLK